LHDGIGRRFLKVGIGISAGEIGEMIEQLADAILTTDLPDQGL
jgi:hypothetical protein